MTCYKGPKLLESTEEVETQRGEEQRAGKWNKQLTGSWKKRREKREKMPDLKEQGCYSRFSGWGERSPMTRSWEEHAELFCSTHHCLLHRQTHMYYKTLRGGTTWWFPLSSKKPKWKHFMIYHLSASLDFFTFAFSVVGGKCFLSFAASSPCPPPHSSHWADVALGNAWRLSVTEIPLLAHGAGLLLWLSAVEQGQEWQEGWLFCAWENNLWRIMWAGKEGRWEVCLLCPRLERLEGWFSLHREKFPSLPSRIRNLCFNCFFHPLTFIC